MNYARLQTCPTTHPEYCFLAAELCGFSSFFAIGRPIEDHFPADPDAARCGLDPELAGVKKPDLLGNTSGVLVLSTRALEAFAAAKLRLGVHDVCAFTLLDHDGKVHSRDYRFVSPHGGVDVAHHDSEFRRYKKSQKIYGCKRWVIDSDKLADKPDLFRSEQVLQHYFVSERLIKVVEEAGLTNFEFNVVRHASGAVPRAGR